MTARENRSLWIAAAQPRCTPYAVPENAAAHAEVVAGAAARVVVFPEMSLTGYELDAESLDPQDARLGPLIDVCEATHSVALVGAPVREKGREFIATLMVDGAGARIAYRKVVLHGLESQRFTPGDAPAVVAVDGWRLGLAICKDTAGPDQAARTASIGMDVYVACVLEHVDDGARTATRACRVAASHRVWVVTASFAGPTRRFPVTAGGSSIVSPNGQVIAQAGLEAGAVVRATVAQTPTALGG